MYGQATARRPHDGGRRHKGGSNAMRLDREQRTVNGIDFRHDTRLILPTLGAIIQNHIQMPAMHKEAAQRSPARQPEGHPPIEGNQFIRLGLRQRLA